MALASPGATLDAEASYRARDYAEARTRLDAALDDGELADSARVRALTLSAVVSMSLGEPARAEAQARAALILDFYARLLAGRRTEAADALRRAQLDLLARFRAERGSGWPQAWGAFVVSGR